MSKETKGHKRSNKGQERNKHDVKETGQKYLFLLLYCKVVEMLPTTVNGTVNQNFEGLFILSEKF